MANLRIFHPFSAQLLIFCHRGGGPRILVKYSPVHTFFFQDYLGIKHIQTTFSNFLNKGCIKCPSVSAQIELYQNLPNFFKLIQQRAQNRQIFHCTQLLNLKHITLSPKTPKIQVVYFTIFTSNPNSKCIPNYFLKLVEWRFSTLYHLVEWRFSTSYQLTNLVSQVGPGPVNFSQTETKYHN